MLRDRGTKPMARSRTIVPKREAYMRHSLRFIPRSLVTVVVLAAGLVATGGAPVAANGNPQPATAWTFILEFPTGNRNAAAVMSLQGGQLAGSAVISGKRCLFKVSGTFSGDDNSGGTFAMTWTGQKTCSGEVLTLGGDVLNEVITGTFTDTGVNGGPFELTGTVISGDND